MPRYLAVNTNFISGTAIFENVKSVVVTYGKTFPRKPIIQLTLDATSTVPPYKTTVTTTQCTIKFQTPFTGNVEWSAIER